MAPRKSAPDNVVEMSRPKREPPMLGRKMSDKQKAATAAGRAKRAEQVRKARAAKARGVPTRWQMLMAGDLRVEDLDDEEISRMQTRDRAGGWSGVRGKIPNHIARQMQRELIKRGGDEFSQSFLAAIRVLVGIANDEEEKGSERLKAAAMIIERVAGKVPDKVLTADMSTWEETFEGIVFDKPEETG